MNKLHAVIRTDSSITHLPILLSDEAIAGSNGKRCLWAARDWTYARIWTELRLEYDGITCDLYENGRWLARFEGIDSVTPNMALVNKEEAA